MSVQGYFNSLYDNYRGNEIISRKLSRIEILDVGDVLKPSMFYRSDLILRMTLLPFRPWTDTHPISNALRDLVAEAPSQSPDDYPVSVRDISGIAASKSHDYGSLEGLACSLHLPHNYGGRYPIEFQTDEHFEKNIRELDGSFRHRPVKVLHRLWDDRRYVENSDGSHKLAAIFRQCREQGRNYRLHCYVHKVLINPDAAQFLLDNYYLLVLHRETFVSLLRVLHAHKIDYRSYEADHITRGHKEPTEVLFIGRHQRYARLIRANFLRQTLPEQVFNLSAYLRHCLMRQARRLPA